MRGAMATLRVPLSGSTPEAAARLHDRLIDEHAIEVPVSARGGSLWVRISTQVYNETEDYARLARAVAKLRWPGFAKTMGPRLLSPILQRGPL